MRLAVVILACCLLGFAAGYRQRYHEKTRFDRSIDDGVRKPVRVRIINKKPRIFTDLETHHTVYKDAHLNVCYLEQFKSNDLNEVKFWRDIISNNKNDFYASERSLTKVEAWRIAGGRIVDFCKGMRIIPLEQVATDKKIEDDPFFNALPEDENDIIQKRVADVVLNPLRARAKRHAIMEERERINEEFVMTERKKREAMPNKGRFRAQTQSQYMNVGNGEKEGKAEAEATPLSSHAVVSGSSGMGQAQSMSSGAEGCDGCPGYQVPGSVMQGLPAGVKIT